MSTRLIRLLVTFVLLENGLAFSTTPLIEEHRLRPTDLSAYPPIRKRESPTVDFSWKTTSKPKFVTGRTQKIEPILTVYPPDVVYRSGRGRELITQSRQPDGLKRVVYYATLPDVSRYVPPALPGRRYSAAGDFSSAPLPAPLNQQRSYDRTKAGEDFVTRVQSSVIDVRPRGDKKNGHGSPGFTIIDASPSYPDVHDRMAILNGLGMTGGRDRFGVAYGYGGNGLVELVPPYRTRPVASAFGAPPAMLHYDARPYHGGGVVVGISSPPQAPLLDHQKNLYTTYTAAPYPNPPPYPTRHNRFPADRYALHSPLATILGSAPTQPAVDIGKPPRYQPAAEGPSTTSTWIPTSSLELGNGGHAGVDYSSLDLANPASRPLSYKNRFAAHLDPYGSGSPFGHKYSDFGTFNTDFSISRPNSPPSSFKPNFPQVSDWLTNKPSLDLSTFELEDFDNALASNAAASGPDGSSSPSTSTSSPTSLSGGVDSFNDLNNTIITPYLASFPNTSNIETQDDR